MNDNKSINPLPLDNYMIVRVLMLAKPFWEKSHKNNK